MGIGSGLVFIFGIYFIGYVLSYTLLKFFANFDNPKVKWTKGDRRSCLFFSLLSWITFFVVFVLFLIVLVPYIIRKMEETENDDASW